MVDFFERVGPLREAARRARYAKKQNADLLRDYTAQFIASVIARATT